MTWKRKSGKGRWTNYKNTETGEESLTENIQPKVVAKWCKVHDYKITDIKKRLCLCNRCKHEGRFVVGRDKIKGDKVVIG